MCRLSPDTTSHTLHHAFAEYGAVVEAVVIQDSRSRRSRGFGFVKFADVESAERSLENPFKCARARQFSCLSFHTFFYRPSFFDSYIGFRPWFPILRSCLLHSSHRRLGDALGAGHVVAAAGRGRCQQVVAQCERLAR